ncbi:protein LYRIC-like isoform X2 [Denticeps clupeoides]|uniref:protein LYRIC-like isoform X2 n=1 Tax=Denticeps clupeoides TaxID=299321 RepID=UPI0010A3EB1B|nr:protein LYRIC isoform X2 [Denticeps clupeoides]
MAASWTEQLSSRLRDLALLGSELGADLGLDPELCPPWAVLPAAGAGLLLLALLLWASACRGRIKRRTPGATYAQDRTEGTQPAPRTAKAEEQKRKSKKRAAEKKGQPNGRAVAEVPEEVKPKEEVVLVQQELPPDAKSDKSKKNKKKPKPVVKDSKSSANGKEPDGGDWETKVSNKEKRQQRRKDKVTGDETASTVGVDPPINVPVPEPPKTTSQKKTKGEVVQGTTSKANSKVTSQVQVISQSEGVVAVNGVGWNDLSPKLQPQISSSEGESWAALQKTPKKPNKDPLVWGQEIEGPWAAGRVMNSALNPVPGLAVQPLPVNEKYGCHPAVDEWSGLNGTSADVSSDWNAPSEVWGNYEEPQAGAPAHVRELAVATTFVSAAVPEEPQRSDDEKEMGDPAVAGSGKSKKKKKKKKKEAEAETAGKEVAQKDSPPVVVAPVQPTAKAASTSETSVKATKSSAAADASSKPPKNSSGIDAGSKPPKNSNAVDSVPKPPKSSAASNASSKPPKNSSGVDTGSKPPKSSAPAEASSKPPKSSAPAEASSKPPKSSAPAEASSKPPKSSAPAEASSKPPKSSAPAEASSKPPKSSAPAEASSKPPKSSAPAEASSKPPKSSTDVDTGSKPPKSSTDVSSKPNKSSNGTDVGSKPPKSSSGVDTGSKPPKSSAPTEASSKPPKNSSVDTGSKPPKSSAPTEASSKPPKSSAKASRPSVETGPKGPVVPENSAQNLLTQVPQRPSEPETAAKQTSGPPPSQIKSEGSSPKQVKKKKARRET